MAMRRSAKPEKVIEADLLALRRFVEEHLRRYGELAREVDLTTVRARAMARFWDVMGCHPQIQPLLFPPDGNYRETLAALELDPGDLPARFHLLYADTFSAWFTDESTSNPDPPVLALNREMDRPFQVSSSFLQYAAYQVVVATLRRWLYLVLETSPPLAGTSLFPALNPSLQQRGPLILVPFDDSEGVQDRRVMVHFRRVAELVRSDIPWESLIISMLGRIACHDEEHHPHAQLTVTGLPVPLQAGLRSFEAAGSKHVSLLELSGHGVWITLDRPAGKKGEVPPAEVVCDRDGLDETMSWVEHRGGTVQTIDGASPKRKKSRRRK
jgi:hypothetical protein